MTRRRGPARTEVVCLRLTPGELAAVGKASSQEELTVSAWIRRTVGDATGERQEPVRTEVALTIEPLPYGYGQHMITVERGNGDWVQCVILTDAELARLETLIADYRASGRSASARFTDVSGRPPAVQEAHGRYVVVS
jgi:hypothetical protein